MSELILVDNVNSLINNINEYNESYKSDKTYNIDYDINDRLRFLQEKYKDYEFKIINNFIQYKTKTSNRFRLCCINFNCIIRATYCKKGEIKPIYCSKCSDLTKDVVETMDKRKCIKCKNLRPSFCVSGETKATHCGNCAKILIKQNNIKFVSIDRRMCIVCNKTIASFRKIGETKTTHCYSCYQKIKFDENIEMENAATKNRRCINILQNNERCKTIAHDKVKYNGYCFDCYFKINPDEIPTKNIKIKENAVVEFIKLIYTQEIREKLNIKDIRFDKYCGSTNKRPDIVIVCENNVIVIEVDEFQHKKESKSGKKYSKENEENKMKLIKEYYKSQNKKTIYIRFNPDDYLTKNNKKINSAWKENEDKLLIVVDETDWKNRLEILKQKINFYLKKKEIKNNSTNYLFYDGYKN